MDALKEVVTMREATASILKSCAKDLEEVQAQLPDNLDPCVIALFESVVIRLERSAMVANDRAALIALIEDALGLIGRLAGAALAVSEAVKHYRG